MVKILFTGLVYYKVTVFPFPFFRSKSVDSARPQRSLKRKVLYIICSSSREICLFSTVCLWQYGLMYIFNTLSYHPVPCCLFSRPSYSNYGHWEFFHTGFYMLPFKIFFIEYFLSVTTRCSSYIFIVPSISYFSKESWVFFALGWYLKPRSGCLDVLVPIVMSLLLSLLNEQS